MQAELYAVQLIDPDGCHIKYVAFAHMAVLVKSQAVTFNLREISNPTGKIARAVEIPYPNIRRFESVFGIQNAECVPLQID